MTRISDAGADDLLLGARVEHDDGRLDCIRYLIVLWTYRAALWLMRRALS